MTSLDLISWKNDQGSTSDLRYDYGKFYASKTFFVSSKNRRILWGWVNESGNSKDVVKKGWFGLQAIPRTLRLDTEAKEQLQWPIEETNKLRGNKVNIQQEKMDGGSIFEILDIIASKVSVEIINLLSAEVSCVIRRLLTL